MSVWTRLVVDRFKQLFTDRYSYSQIAKKLSEEFSITLTRNATIGFANRIKMPKRKKTDIPRKSEVRIDKPGRGGNPLKAPAPLAPYTPRPEVGKGSVTLMQLKPRSCRWPFGDRPPFLYCGCMTVEGHPYCEDHMRLGHVKWQPPTAA